VSDALFTSIVSIVTLSVLAVFVIAIDSYGCASKASRMQFDYSYGPIQGCMVKTRQGWRPIEAIRDIDP
jgi:hypothetical protein